MTAALIFRKCVEAIRAGALIRRESKGDKEFHFQNWFSARLDELGINYDQGGGNSYPDFRMVKSTKGYELKGLAYPGRDANFDSNSQVPTGFHNGRTIYYVFGRYPPKPDGNEFPVLDLVVCHGDFLNADHQYVHKNRSVRGFGIYGDLMIRDRKMYVVPTPFHLVNGAANRRTLILPEGHEPGEDFVKVGGLVRHEAAAVVVGYTFNLQTNELTPETIPNPHAGREHRFCAWRLSCDPAEPVSMNVVRPDELAEESDDD